MMRRFIKTLALTLPVLGMTATLALAQPGDTSTRPGMRDNPESAGRGAFYATDRQDPSWQQSWNHVGSGGTNIGLHSGKNPYAEPVEPHGVNNPGADYSGYRMQNR